MTMKKKYQLILLISFLFLSTLSFAQPPIFEEIVDDEIPPAPIDGFIVLSLLAGAGLGFKKLRK